jgi:hypothetical protein
MSIQGMEDTDLPKWRPRSLTPVQKYAGVEEGGVENERKENAASKFNKRSDV